MDKDTPSKKLVYIADGLERFEGELDIPIGAKDVLCLPMEVEGASIARRIIWLQNALENIASEHCVWIY